LKRFPIFPDFGGATRNACDPELERKTFFNAEVPSRRGIQEEGLTARKATRTDEVYFL